MSGDNIDEYIEDNLSDLVESRLHDDKFWDLILEAIDHYQPAMEALRDDVRSGMEARAEGEFDRLQDLE